MEKFDGVLVVGAGPVGIVTALGLARAGIPVRILEAEPEIVNSPRAVVYHWSVLESMDRLGILDDLKREGFIKQDYQYRVLDSGETFTFDLSPLEGHTDYPYNVHLGQHDLARLALTHLEKLQGEVVRWNSPVVAVEQDDGGVIATVETPEGPKRYAAKWLIGADGGRSGVRSALNLSFDGFTWPDRFVATNLWYDFEKHGYSRSTLLLDHVNWAVLAKIDESNLWRCTYGEDASLPEDEMIKRVPEHYKILLPGDEPYKLEMAAPYRLHQRAVESFRNGRVLLAGDAAHVTNPVGGLGLTSGLFDAFALAPTMAAVIHGEEGVSVLDRWAADRCRIFLEIVSPAATDNKRRMSESDPERQKQDRERLRRVCEDREFALQAHMFTKSIESEPYVGRALGQAA